MRIPHEALPAPFFFFCSSRWLFCRIHWFLLFCLSFLMTIVIHFKLFFSLVRLPSMFFYHFAFLLTFPTQKLFLFPFHTFQHTPVDCFLFLHTCMFLLSAAQILHTLHLSCTNHVHVCAFSALQFFFQSLALPFQRTVTNCLGFKYSICIYVCIYIYII